VVAQDVADDELLPGGLRLGDDGFRGGDAFRQRLFDEDMATGLEGGLCIGAVGVRVGGNADRVRLGGGERVIKVREFRIAAPQFGIELAAAFRGAGDDPADLKPGNAVSGP
jgi:hypothetical protein